MFYRDLYTDGRDYYLPGPDRRICADCRTIHDQSAGGSIGTDPPLLCGQDSDRRGTWTKKSLFQKVSQSTILCTGASYHKSMATVVRDTAYTCEILQLPQAPFEVPEELWNQNDMKYIPVTDPEHIVLPQERITPEKVWRRGAENPPEYMVVQGGLTDAW